MFKDEKANVMSNALVFYRDFLLDFYNDPILTYDDKTIIIDEIDIINELLLDLISNFEEDDNVF